MAGFAKTTFAVAAGILLAILALAGLALASAVVYHNYVDVPNYVLAADEGKASVDAKDAASLEYTTLEPGSGVDFVTAAAGDEFIVRYHAGDLRDRQFRVPKRNLRSYATGQPLSPGSP